MINIYFSHTILMDDFYTFINKDWLNSIQLNSDQVRTNSFEQIAKYVQKQLYEIINENVKKNTFMGKMFHKIQYETTNIEHYDKYFKMIDDIVDMNDFLKVYGDFMTYNTSVFFALYVGRNIKNPKKHTFNFGQSKCTLSDKSYYENYKPQYIEFIKVMGNLCKFDSTDIYELEYMLSKIVMTSVQKRDIDSRLNILSLEEFKKLWPFDISLVYEDYFKIWTTKPTEICVDNLQYIQDLVEIINKFNINVLKNYLKYKFILSLPKLCKTEDIVHNEFKFFKKTLSGITTDTHAQSRALAYIMKYIPNELGKLYLKKYMHPKTEKYVLQMTQMLKSSTKDIIVNCSWLSNGTKDKIYDKINNMGIKIGGTTQPKSYENYEKYIKLNNVDMTIAMEIESMIENLKKLDTEVDKNKWSMESYSVNAYYSPLNNELVIPCAILNEPFFDINKSIYDNLGGIGSVISHEISHGFDDQGRKFNKDGLYKIWWPKEDISEFNKRIVKIKTEYSNAIILGQQVSGDITIGENIADYTGMLILTNILKINEVSYCNFAKVYSTYAKIWRQKIRDKEMIKRIKTDVHAPPILRTNIILSHIPEFAETFGLTKYHSMYKSEEQRFDLWK